MPFIAIAFFIAAVLGGGTATVAQASLPGDLLWNFKVHVNESVAGTLAASDQARADWDLALITTRLAETERLSAKGRLTTEAEADIATNIQEHAANITNTVAKLQTQGDVQTAANIAARYQATLAAVDMYKADSPTSLYTALGQALEHASTLSASVSAAVR